MQGLISPLTKAIAFALDFGHTMTSAFQARPAPRVQEFSCINMATVSTTEGSSHTFHQRANVCAVEHKRLLTRLLLVKPLNEGSTFGNTELVTHRPDVSSSTLDPKLRAQIHDRCQVQPPFQGPQVGDVGGPGVIGAMTARSNRFEATGWGSVPNVFAGTVPSLRFQNAE